MKMFQKIKFITLIAAVLSMVFSLSGRVSAQAPQGGGGPSPEEIQAQAQGHGPSAAEIQQFENQFGGPPTSFPQPEIQKPQFEQPGTIPDEVKQYVSDKDLVAVYCAMTRWKSGQFFAAMDAVQKYVIEPTKQVEQDFGITLDIPDINAIKAEGQQKIDAICNASTSNQAEQLTLDFIKWGQQDTQAKFDAMRQEMQDKIKVQSDAMQAEIKSEIQPFIDEQKAAIESEIKAKVQPLVDEKVAEITAGLAGGGAPPDVSSLNAEVTSYVESHIQALVASKKEEMQKTIQAKVDEIVGPKKAKFEKIGDSFQNVGQKINDYIQANQSQYDKYKTQAFDLRKNLVLGILDKNIQEGLAKLDAASANLAEAKKNDPSVKDVSDIKAELQQDRQALVSKMDAALEAGDENAFQQALVDFRTKWQEIQKQGEAAMQQSVSKVCSIALDQFNKANAQMDPGIKKIKDLQASCANSTTDECLKVNQFSSRFETILSKFSDLKAEMSIASKMCQDPQNADKTNLIALMNKIQSDAEDIKVYGQALDAEKSKVLATTQAEICSQAMPQLDAALTEIKKNDLTSLQNNINNCQGKTTEACKVVNGLTSDFNSLKSQITQFAAGVENVRTLCSKPASEEDFKNLADTLSMLKASGQTLEDSAQALQAKQSEKMSEKILCRTVVPELENAKSAISSGIADMRSVQSNCRGKNTPECSSINSLGSKFTDINTQADAMLKKISNIESACQNALDNVPSDSFISDLNSLKTDEDTIQKAIDDLKAEKNKGYQMGTEITIPRNSTWEATLPAGKTLELFGRINYQRAAGALWIMEIYVNGKPLSSPLTNKGKTFKYADGRSFPYYSPGGGGSAQTSFKDGKPYTYYFSQTPAWMLFYAPDYTTDNSSAGGNYQILTDPGQAHRYVWDISSLAGNSGTIDVEIRNNGIISTDTLPIMVKLNVK